MPRVPSRIDYTTGKASTTLGTFALERTGSRSTDDAQTKARTATAPAAALPFGDGNLIAGVAMTSSVAVDLTHRLGRAARGAFPISIVGPNLNKWTCTSLGTATSGAVTVVVDQTAVVDWWVF
jgi:hypothetical protein